MAILEPALENFSMNLAIFVIIWKQFSRSHH